MQIMIKKVKFHNNSKILLLTISNRLKEDYLSMADTKSMMSEIRSHKSKSSTYTMISKLEK